MLRKVSSEEVINPTSRNLPQNGCNQRYQLPLWHSVVTAPYRWNCKSWPASCISRDLSKVQVFMLWCHMASCLVLCKCVSWPVGFCNKVFCVCITSSFTGTLTLVEWKGKRKTAEWRMHPGPCNSLICLPMTRWWRSPKHLFMLKHVNPLHELHKWSRKKCACSTTSEPASSQDSIKGVSSRHRNTCNSLQTDMKAILYPLDVCTEMERIETDSHTHFPSQSFFISLRLWRAQMMPGSTTAQPSHWLCWAALLIVVDGGSPHRTLW